MYFRATARKIIQGSVRGLRTTDIIQALDLSGDLAARRALAQDLLSWLGSGAVVRETSGRWRWVRTPKDVSVGKGVSDAISADASQTASADASRAALYSEADQDPPPGPASPDARPGVERLLAYYHAALRSDVRGKAVLLPQNHGHSWTLFTGEGEWWAAEGRTGRIDIPLGNLPATFRMALERRADDDTIAIGWALSKGRDDGLDVIWPVGLLAARWWRADEILCIAIEQPDVMVNPAWLRAQAGSLGWSQVDLADRLGGWRGEGVGPGRDLDEFAGILREAAATAVRGRLYPRSIVPALGAEDGIWGAAALILPEEDNWSRRAVRDLEKIQNWSPEQRQGTALQAVLDPVPINDSEPVGPVLEAGPLNAEQLEAVRSGLTGRLTVVTGPPGTGKSETVSALVCSTVLAGKTVLVAARNHQALDAVEERVGGTWVVRTLDPAGDRDTSFRDAAKDLVSMPDPQDPAGDLEGAIAALGLLDGRRVKAMEERLAWRQAHLELAEAIEARGPASPWWRRLLWAMLGGRSRRSLLPRSGPLKIARLQMKAQQARPAEDAASLGEMIREAVGEILEKAFRSRLSLGDQRRGWLGRRLQDLKLHGNIDLPDDVIDLVLEARPVWLTSNLGTPARIPLRAGLFDLAVIDEASQSDIASALPILARARRVVVVGDDRQLGFISRTSGAMERNLMRAAGIESTVGMGIYAQGLSSLFDLAKVQSAEHPQGHAVMLVDQYRSAPEITDFIGETFYDGQLRPAVDSSTFILPQGAKAGIDWVDVGGYPERSPDGGWLNRAEAQAIARHVKRLLVDEAYDGSVGIVTPFNAQAGALKRAIWADVPEPRRAAANLKVGTVDSFQGEQRMLMIFSPVAAGTNGHDAARFLMRDRRRVNVAISRAQAVLLVFGDLAFARKCNVSTLRQLAARATEPRRHAGDAEAGSLWELRLKSALERAGLDPQPQYPVLGRRLDFALFAGDVKLDVEVDGRRWHTDIDGNRKTDDVFRDAQLRGAGWRVLRFWVSELDQNMEKCVERIKRELE